MPYDPHPSHKFTFGLWTVGNIGRDPFGGPVREPLTAVELVHLLADVGVYGANFHDNDLVPIDAALTERNQIVRRNLLPGTWAGAIETWRCGAIRYQQESSTLL